MDLNEIGLPPRALKALTAQGIGDTDALCMLSVNECLAVRGVGETSLMAIRRRLMACGLSLAGDDFRRERGDAAVMLHVVAERIWLHVYSTEGKEAIPGTLIDDLRLATGEFRHCWQEELHQSELYREQVRESRRLLPQIFGTDDDD